MKEASGMKWAKPLQPGVAYLYPLITSGGIDKQHRAVKI